MKQLVNVEDLVEGSLIYVKYANGDYVSGTLELLDAEGVTFFGVGDEFELTDVSYVEVEAWPTWLMRVVQAVNSGTLGEGEAIRVLTVATGKTPDAASHIFNLVRQAA